MPKTFIQNRAGATTAIDETFTPNTGWEFLSFELEITTQPTTEEDVVLFLARYEGATVELLRETPSEGSVIARYTLRRTAGQLENIRFGAGDTLRVAFDNSDNRTWEITMTFTEGDIL